MEFGAGTYALGFTAGVLSILSPCILPLIPIVVASAASAHRFGALALSSGLMISFTAIGLFVATIAGLRASVRRSALPQRSLPRARACRRSLR